MEIKDALVIVSLLRDKKYAILTAPVLPILERNVNVAIELGYTPVGSIILDGRSFCQAVLKH